MQVRVGDIVRQSIGATWILQLVIVFMLLFVGFLALSINYTKAFKIKNEMLSIIEKYEGVSSGDSGSIAIINNYLRYNNYQTMGTCSDGSYGVSDLSNNTIVPASNRTKYYYCIKKLNTSDVTYPDRVMYKVDTFFKFNIPFLGDMFTFQVKGETIDISWPNDDLPIEIGQKGYI